MRAALLSAACWVLAACAVQGSHEALVTQQQLLSGTALFDSPVAVEPPSPQDIFGIDEGMRAFVREQAGSTRDTGITLRRLLTAMRERGLFSLDYSADVTHTARETFYTRQGNCLSFTILFVALAREAGLPVRYQMVDIPPIWSSKSEFIVLNNHINALIKTELQPSYVVDFNIEEFKGNYDTQEVNDSYALALFYSNLGVEALMAQDYETSFVYLSSAIRAYPRIPGPWVNLGLLYSRRGLYEYAESAYLNALDIDPRNRSALTDLAALYSAMGDEERAQAYRDRIRSYQQRNPYYHYALAQDAYQASRYTDALKLVAEAIKLKRNEHQFYFLQGLAYFRLGQRRDAENSFVQAKKYAELGETISLYDAKIEALSRER